MIESAKAGRGGSSGGGGWWVVQKDAQEDGILNLFPETADNLIMLFPTESAAPPPGQWNGSTVHFLTFSTIESRGDHPPQEPQTKHCVGRNGGKKVKESGPTTFASYGLYVGMWLYTHPP